MYVETVSIWQWKCFLFVCALMCTLCEGLYGVDAPAHFSAALPKPHNWFQGGGGFATEGGIKRIWEKVAEGEGREETERERETGQHGRERRRGIASSLLGTDASASGVPGRKTNFMYLGVTKHFWLIDLIRYNTLFAVWSCQLRGGLSPWPNLETVCLHPPSVEGPVDRHGSFGVYAWLIDVDLIYGTFKFVLIVQFFSIHSAVHCFVGFVSPHIGIQKPFSWTF